MKSKLKAISTLIILFMFTLSCSKGEKEYSIENPSPLNILGKNIENVKKNMSKANLVYSGSKFTEKKVEKAFEWEFLPKLEQSDEIGNFMSSNDIDIANTKQESIFKEASLTAQIDRRGRIVSVRLEYVFKDIDVFRFYYKLRLGYMMKKTDRRNNKILCFNVDSSPLGNDDVEKFVLEEEELQNWRNVRKCEQVGWKSKDEKGQGMMTKFSLNLDHSVKPEERNKKNKGERKIIWNVGFESYM